MFTQRIPNYTFKMGNDSVQCSMGRSGIKKDKKEGDGATPEGEFKLLYAYYRPDKFTEEIKTAGLQMHALAADNVWCDDVRSKFYNQLIKLSELEKHFIDGKVPSHEELWRTDNLYDIIVVIDYNINPIIEGKGSAIFLHIAKPDYAPTAGCVGLTKEHLLKFLETCTAETTLTINHNGTVLAETKQPQAKEIILPACT